MKLGDKVKLSEEGKYEYADHARNPHCLNGVIIELNSDKLYGDEGVVMWSNSETNSYVIDQLSLVESIEKPLDDTGYSKDFKFVRRPSQAPTCSQESLSGLDLWIDKVIEQVRSDGKSDAIQAVFVKHLESLLKIKENQFIKVNGE